MQIRGRPPEVVEAFARWVRDFILFHSLRHPETMGEAEIGAFLTHRTLDRLEPLPRQTQARTTLLFLYCEFLHRDLGPIPMSWSRGILSPAGPVAEQAPRPLLDQVCDVLRVQHDAGSPGLALALFRSLQEATRLVWARGGRAPGKRSATAAATGT